MEGEEEEGRTDQGKGRQEGVVEGEGEKERKEGEREGDRGEVAQGTERLHPGKSWSLGLSMKRMVL